MASYQMKRITESDRCPQGSGVGLLLFVMNINYSYDQFEIFFEMILFQKYLIYVT